MKNKRFPAMVLAALMTLALAACGSESAAVPDSTPTAEATAEATVKPSTVPTASPTVEPTVEPTVAHTAAPTAEPTSTPTTAPTATPSATPEPAGNSDASSQVDYSGDVTDWMYTPDSDDELTNLLVSIDSTPYGTAGGSMQQANAAVCLMKLSMEDRDKVVNTVSTYLSEMNGTQKDFFSFQWQQALKTANDLLDGTEDAAILEDAGDRDFDLSAVDTAQVTDLNQAITDLLQSAGVTDEWKNETDVDFFSYATP